MVKKSLVFAIRLDERLDLGVVCLSSRELKRSTTDKSSMSLTLRFKVKRLQFRCLVVILKRLTYDHRFICHAGVRCKRNLCCKISVNINKVLDLHRSIFRIFFNSRCIQLGRCEVRYFGILVETCTDFIKTVPFSFVCVHIAISVFFHITDRQ